VKYQTSRFAIGSLKERPRFFDDLKARAGDTSSFKVDRKKEARKIVFDLRASGASKNVSIKGVS
jgi:hypothetical protein